jgi:hypothetical protein
MRPSPSATFGGSTRSSTIRPRAPLPPFDPSTFESPDPETPASWHPVYTTLPIPPLARPSIRWWRGDAWAVTLDGLPLVDGGATGPAQSRVLTYFLDRYGSKWEDTILRAHVEDGYTHFSISPQDSFAAGLSVAAYVAMARRVKDAGLFVHHLMRSKYYTPAQPDLSAMDALIGQLLEAGCLDVHTPAWEMNYWSPEICRAMIDHDAALIGTRASFMLHFYPHYISWQLNTETPGDFWQRNVGKVDGTLYQADPSWSAGMMAARMTDALDRLAPGGLWGLGDSGRGHPFDVVGWETIATKQFNNDIDGNDRLADEDHGNLKGFELCCAPGRMAVMGFGNGGRMPDGTAL